MPKGAPRFPIVLAMANRKVELSIARIVDFKPPKRPSIRRLFADLFGFPQRTRRIASAIPKKPCWYEFGFRVNRDPQPHENSPLP
jgi:hypothetical protein